MPGDTTPSALPAVTVPSTRAPSTGSPVVEALAGKRVLVTGATGFLGTALIEKLLRSVPGCEVIALVRPSRRARAEERLHREVLRNDCFDTLRAALGSSFEDVAASRLHALAGDVALDGLGLDEAGRDEIATCDVVVHAAASVAFDSPLDAAVEVNLLGPSRVADNIEAVAGRRRSLRPGRAPTHLISVSTAYVAGTHPGKATETLSTQAMSSGAHARTHTTVTTEVDIAAEIASARRLRGDLEADSRSSARLRRFEAAARRELGPAGTHVLAERAEKLRADWVSARLVRAGRDRAQALGWPDVYAFTKALGERLLATEHPALPVSIVRPSIIESARSEPRPGWIRGFRMAEPIIVSYARGLLKEFPGTPEGVIDVIPVDFVVNAIIAVAAAGPDPAGSAVYHVASGVRNPLSYGHLVDLVRAWFTDHPLYDSAGQPIVVPEWSFPGRGRVKRQLDHATRALGAAEQLLALLPVRGSKAALAGRIEERRARYERALGYVELYGAYTETEARFAVEHLLDLWERLSTEDRLSFCFDPAVIDWDRYVLDVHLPSVVSHARVRTSPSRSVVASRGERGRSAVLAPARELAAFDLENTLVASNVVETYAWLASRDLDRLQRVALAGRLIAEAPRLLALDRRDRGELLRSFYRRYEGASARMLFDAGKELFSDLLVSRSFPAGFDRVRKHRALGHKTVLITGALDFVVEPLRPLFDEIICASISTSPDGYLTGRLERIPPIGEARALALSEYAEREGIDLANAVVYADSVSDLPMLEAAGYPVAVNPDARLSAIARRRGWHVENWSKAASGVRPFAPLAPRLRERGVRGGSISAGGVNGGSVDGGGVNGGGAVRGGLPA